MKVIPLSQNSIGEFKKYFSLYSGQQDESFPPPENYSIREDEPVYLLVNDEGVTAGAASLMKHRNYAEAGEARFRMFHCVKADSSHYKMLLDEILKHSQGLKSIFCFVQDKYTDTIQAWEKLGFKLRRYSWVLKRGVENAAAPEFPEGFEVKTLRDGVDEQAWCDIIDEAFENMLGHTTLHPEKIDEWRADAGYIPGGMKLLWHGNKPVGTVALIKEREGNEDVVFIESIAVLNSLQGKGLGRNLLRYSVEFGRQFGVKNVMLSVNAENQKAAELYLGEGFTMDSTYLCYHYNI